MTVKLIVLGALFFDLPGRMVVTVQEAPKTPEHLVVEPAPMAQALAAEGDTQTPGDQAQNQQDSAVLPGGEDNQSLHLKEQDLKRKEESLKKLEKEIDEKLVRLQKLESQLSRLVEQANGIKDKKLKHLIDVYSNMKAQQAATVIETLNEDIAVRILAGMRGRQAGEILTYVKAEKAARLTERLTKLQVPFD